MVAFDLSEELQALGNLDTYSIEHEHDPAEKDPGSLLEVAVEAVAENSSNITDREVFDVYRSLLKYSSSVPGLIMSKLLDSITSAFAAELKATMDDVENNEPQVYMEHKTPLEMYAFLLQWFVSAAEKVKSGEGAEDANQGQPGTRAKKGRGGKAGGTGRAGGRKVAAGIQETWTWVRQIPETLGLISKVLNRVQTQRIWSITAEREAFVTCMTKPAWHLTESEVYMKSIEIRKAIYKVIALAVKHHFHAIPAQVTIIQSLTFYEHLAEPMAELLAVLVQEFDHHQLGDEVLREIAGKRFGAQDSKGPRTFGRFLVKYAEVCPHRVLKMMSLLLEQLDSESYPMRISVVDVIGYIINELALNLDQDAPGTIGTQPGETQLDSQDPTGNPSSSANVNPADPKTLQRQLSQYFSLLLERTLDVSSYVRAKVFSVSLRLLTLRQKFPKHRLQLTRVAVGALEDKAASVRKGAVMVLSRLLGSHPYGLAFGGYLEREEWEREYKDVKEKLEEVEKVFEMQGLGGVPEEEGEEEDEMDVDGEEGEDDDDEGEVAMDIDPDADSQDPPPKPRKKSKSKKKKSRPRPSIHNTQAALDNLDLIEHDRLKMRKKYFVEALDFIRQIEDCMEKMGELLGSKNKPEVLEAMEFFKLGWEYKVNGAKVGIKKMLHLIWTKDPSTTTTTTTGAGASKAAQPTQRAGEDDEPTTSTEMVKGIRSRLLECYRQLYFDAVDDREMTAKDQVNRIAKNMIERTYEATLAELTSLEELMRIMHEEGYVHYDIIAKLWQVYSSSRPLPKPQRRGAIIILGMLASAKRSVVTDKVDVMLKVGLGGLGKQDLTLARYTCVALQRLAGSHKKIKGSLFDKSHRFPMDYLIFQKLRTVIERPCRSKDWFPLAEQAINTIYALGDHPDELCGEIIKRLTVTAFSPKPAIPAPVGDAEGISTQQPPSQTPAEDQQQKDLDAMDEDPPASAHPEATQASAYTSTAPFSTQQFSSQAPSQSQSQGGEKDLGDAFELSQLLFVVGHVAIKQIVYLELVERELKRQKDEKAAAEKLANKDRQNTSKDHEELDQVAGNAEDEIGERIQLVRESELLYGDDSLLAIYGPILVQICGTPAKFKNKTLRAAATLSLSKFLCVSSTFCEQHHRLLFKILETSRDPNIRSNIVIALGDVAVSFSNIIDENTNELYKGLKDKDPGVKKNTLMVLTHLILNGMIKVKGQLGEMAKCIEDPDPRIVDLAKLFFEELSTKENAIYNNLPDVISHLSTGEHAVPEEAFQSILKYIFKFVEKEKQAENIVQKLCERFRLAEDPRQWRDIAFCLSLLPYKSERSVKKLTDGLPHYRDKLHEKQVYEYFAEILKTARSNKGKDKSDNDLDDFEKALAEHKEQGEEDQALEKRATKKRAAAAKKRGGRGRAKAAPAPVVDEEEEFLDD